MGDIIALKNYIWKFNVNPQAEKGNIFSLW